MPLDRIDAQADDLGIPLLELGLESRHVAEFRRADRREILGMREKDRPLVADPFVEMDRALRGLGFEIGGGVVDAQGHDGDGRKGFASRV